MWNSVIIHCKQKGVKEKKRYKIFVTGAKNSHNHLIYYNKGNKN